MPIKQYLPSKKFSKKILIIVGILLLIVIVKYIDWTGLMSHFGRKAKIQNGTLGEAIFVDTDGDGVADWEESLWGTDPKKVATFNGVNDLNYITEKRKTLSQNGDDTTTETDRIAQEFFSSIIILKDSGALTEESATILAGTLAEKLTSEDTLPDAITGEKITKVPSTDASRKKYITDLASLLKKYEKEGAGSEISILAYILKNEDKEGTKDLEDASNAYIALGGELTKIKVPTDIAETHRRFANASIKTGIALKKLMLLYDNSTVAIPGIIQYQKYSEEFNNMGEQLVGTKISSR